MRYISIFILCLLLSCELEEPKGPSLSVVSYNVEAFFDNIDHGNEFYDDLYEKDYNKRIALMQDVLKTDEIASADIIFFQEVENEKVLCDLLDSGLRKRGFTYYGVTSSSSSPIQLGFISKHRVMNLNANITTTRDILTLTIYKDKKFFNFIVVHAKSRIGENTNEIRKDLARHINVLVKRDKHSRFIILGDFNTELVYDSSDLISSGNESAVINSGSIPTTPYYSNITYATFYDPFSDYSYPFLCDGTYYYKDDWYMLDHIMFNKAVADDLKTFKAHILNLSILKDEFGKPYSFDRNRICGYSDHFPIKVDLYY